MLSTSSSSKSSKEIGVRLSAFNLKYSSEYLKKTVSVETVFQAAKVFEGEETPNVEIMNMNPNEAKSYIKTKQSRKLKKFILGDIEFGLEPKTFFYDWLYINALLQNKNLIEELLDYDAFTDIEFNPQKSINCQAKSAALFVGLVKQGSIDYKNIKEITQEKFKDILGIEERYETIGFFN